MDDPVAGCAGPNSLGLRDIQATQKVSHRKSLLAKAAVCSDSLPAQNRPDIMAFLAPNNFSLNWDVR